MRYEVGQNFDKRAESRSCFCGQNDKNLAIGERTAASAYSMDFAVVLFLLRFAHRRATAPRPVGCWGHIGAASFVIFSACVVHVLLV